MELIFKRIFRSYATEFSTICIRCPLSISTIKLNQVSKIRNKCTVSESLDMINAALVGATADAITRHREPKSLTLLYGLVTLVLRFLKAVFILTDGFLLQGPAVSADSTCPVLVSRPGGCYRGIGSGHRLFSRWRQVRERKTVFRIEYVARLGKQA